MSTTKTVKPETFSEVLIGNCSPEVLKEVLVPTKEDHFIKGRTGKLTHEIASINKRKSEKKISPKIDEDEKLIQEELKEYKNNLETAQMRTPVKAGFSTSDFRTLLLVENILLTKEAKENAPAYMYLDRYMEVCRIKDRKFAKTSMERALTILSVTAFKVNSTKFTSFTPVIKQAIWNKERKRAEITLNELFIEEYEKYPVCYMSKHSLALNAHNYPNSLYFSYKITNHKQMNLGKTNENIISVKTLIENSDLPQENERIKAINQKIVEPFERDMDALEKDFSWEYVDKDNNILEKEKRPHTNYNEWLSRNIKITWKQEFPSQLKDKKEKRKEYIKKDKNKTTYKKR